jgi:uncharacterized OsmC-like protein
MTTTQTRESSTTQSARRPIVPLNGVDTPTLFATLDAVKAQPELGQFQFRASNRWLRGTHSRTRIDGFSGAGGVHAHVEDFQYDADHPKVLVGNDRGPTPVEFLLHALAACLTAGIGNIAAARGITLEEVESTVEGDIDVNGLLGLNEEVRNGYQQVRIHFKIRGDAPPETLRALVERSRDRSAVFDVLTNPTAVAIEVDAG